MEDLKVDEVTMYLSFQTGESVSTVEMKISRNNIPDNTLPLEEQGKQLDYFKQCYLEPAISHLCITAFQLFKKKS